MTDLSDLIDRVEIELNDTSNATWSTTRIEAAIRTALRRYSQTKPRRVWSEITTTDGEREYSLAALGEILEVMDVWYPFTSADPEFPPERPGWEILETGELRIKSDDAPAASEKIRVLATMPHTIAALDSASATTLTAQEKQLIVLGAAGYCAEAQSLAVINTVTASSWTQRQYADWAKEKIAQFETIARELARREDTTAETRVQWPEIDDDDQAHEDTNT
jgi:hypothetical protein